MHSSPRQLSSVLAIAMLGGALAFGHADTVLAQSSAPVNFAPHRAIYDLKLVNSRGRRSLESVQGRIVYDFSGNACEGYALQFRQVTELDSGEGKVIVSDLRSTTWEDAAARSFRFNFQNFMDRKLVDAVDGRATRSADKAVAVLGKPQDKKVELGNVTFPTDHMRKIIEAARDRKPLLEVPVYDGSENGEKVYNTLAVIGQPIAPTERPPEDAIKGKDIFANLPRWPVTISYFERGKTAEGEQTPVYSIKFELYENGISRALTLDYGDFVLAGTMTTLDVTQPKPCQ